MTTAVRSAQKYRSLLNLKLSLKTEEYEACSYWARQAVKYGATRREISFILANPDCNLEEEFTHEKDRSHHRAEKVS